MNTSITDNGSCWNEAPFGPGQSNGLLCELKAGHEGAHKAGYSEWMSLPSADSEPTESEIEAYLLEEWKHESWGYDNDDVLRCECGQVLDDKKRGRVAALDQHRVTFALRAARAAR